MVLALGLSPAWGGTMYEWNDPQTGKLKAGDKPPQGVKFWVDGQRPEKTKETAKQQADTGAKSEEQRALEEKDRSERSWAEHNRRRQEQKMNLLSRPAESDATAQAEAVGVFDIEAHCKKVSQAMGGSYQIEQTCRDQERKAQANISTMAVPPEIVSHCGRVGRAVGGSYQIMLTCVEQEMKAKANLR